MPCARQRREEAERAVVGRWGLLSSDSVGRLRPEEPCPTRTCFQRDVDRITYSKSFRRLKHKTQVFLRPEGDHYRTRLTHTLEVSRIARTVARALELNEDLTEAIALGHDLGHTPFGHAGERALDEIFSGGFRHYEQSLRVVDRLERDLRGLNLCHETRMGILHHTYGAENDTLEAVTVRLADRIAYINHDVDDAVRAGILQPGDLPEQIRERLGARYSLRISSIVTDLIENSGGGVVRYSPEMEETMAIFHDFMYDSVYRNPKAKGEESKVTGIIRGIWDWFVAHPERLPEDYRRVAAEEGVERAVTDYVSGMTDVFAVETYGDIFIPMAWSVK